MGSFEKTAAAFVVGAIAGAMLTEAGVCMCYPSVKRSMMKKGMHVMRAVKHMGERMFY